MPAYIGSKDDSGNRLEGRCNQFHLYGASDVDDRLEATLRGQMEHFYFPVDLNYLSAQINFHPLAGKNIQIGSATITARRLIHPNGVLGYRIQDGDKALCVATDCEHPSDGTLDKNLLELAQGCDLLIYDSQYTPEEYNPEAHGLKGPPKIGWGHSTYAEGIRVANECKVGRLILTHHDPLHNDAKVAEMEKKAQEAFPSTLAAYEGLVIQL